MRVIVTRPAAQAALWVQDLRAAGIDALALPLIAIEAPAEPGAVTAAWAGLGRKALVFFVSPNAVQHFFALAPAGAGWPPGVIAASPGPGTSAALQALGVPVDLIEAPPVDAESFDSAALWSCIGGRAWAGREVLVVRGEDGRDWLAEQFRAGGATVEYLAAYRRRAPLASPAMQAVVESARADPARHLWLFSSSEAVGHLQALAPGLLGAHTLALATHPRIAATARAAGAGHVALCAPSLAAATAAIRGWPIQSAPS